MTNLLDELKQYLRIDGEDEDLTLNMFIQSAKLYLQKAGVKQPSDYYKIVDSEDIFAQHRLAIMMLATHFYENRIVVTPTTIKTAQQIIPYGLQSIILQLELMDLDELSTQ